VIVIPPKGRGAWTRLGGLLPSKPGGQGAYYRLAAAGEERVGSHWGRRATIDYVGDDHRAVNLAVKAIQTLAGMPVEQRDGDFGPLTDRAVRAAQTKANVTADGIVGRGTMRAWLTPLIRTTATAYGVPEQWLGGIAAHESSLDPGAVGYTTPDDKGLVQIRLTAHPTVTWDQAFDPAYALSFAARDLRAIHDRWAGKTTVDAWQVACLSHNSPTRARQYATTGQWPTTQARTYVEKVSAAW